jgi:hypothetical protein
MQNSEKDPAYAAREDEKKKQITHNNAIFFKTHVPSSSSVATPSSHPRNSASSPSVHNNNA